MKKIVCLLVLMIIFCCSCSGSKEETNQLDLVEMRNISEMATLECYYHNVARFYKENSSTPRFWEKGTSFWFWDKDTFFWIQYNSIVKIGVDTSEIKMSAKRNEVKVTIPKAKILSVDVQEKSLNKKSFYVGVGTTNPTVKDQIKAFKMAEKKTRDTAKADTYLLNSAQQQAKSVIDSYITNVGKLIGVKYNVTWVYE